MAYIIYFIYIFIAFICRVREQAMNSTVELICYLQPTHPLYTEKNSLYVCVVYDSTCLWDSFLKLLNFKLGYKLAS